MIDLPHADVWLSPVPAVWRPAEHSLLRPGAFRPCSHAERNAIIADLLRTGRLAPNEAKAAMFFVPVVGWTPPLEGNDAFTYLLLHCDGSDGSTSFSDSSQSNLTMSVTGNAQVDAAQSKFGGGSLLLDGIGDYLFHNDTSVFDFGTGDFAIDFWLRLAAAQVGSEAAHCLIDLRSAGGGNEPYVFYVQDGEASELFYLFSDELIHQEFDVPTETWLHIAMTRASGAFRCFLNGSLLASITRTDNCTNGRLTIGTFVDQRNTSDDWKLAGWMDEIRISKGAARWTASFAPPTSPYG